MYKILHFSYFIVLLLSCSTEQEPLVIDDRTITMLNLGDSYTYGQSVCDDCSFPAQLKDTLQDVTELQVEYTSIAQTGWTTTDLLATIETVQLDTIFDLVTLLIGVNNQYQNQDFSLYESEFVELLDQSIEFADGDANRVFVISIPDYAFTPFGQASSNPNNISEELDAYNLFARLHSQSKGVQFINITDITRQGLNDKNLVATDQLHPSAKAYSKIVARIFPSIYQQIK